MYAAFTGTPSRQAELWAALLRAGPGATLSHYTAAELDGLTDKPCEQIHVTVPATRNPGRRKIPGLIIHRSSRIETARHPALSPPRTRVEETVLDLVEASRDFDEAFSWLCRAVGRRRTTTSRLAAAIAARKRMRWRSELTAALADVADGVHSLLERRYVTGVERAHGLPRATRQVRRGLNGPRATYIDNLYEEYDVCVEMDGTTAHPVEERWRDIRRDNMNTARGTVTLRFGWPDATQYRCRSAILVGDTLRDRGWTGTLRPCSPGCPVGHP